MRAYIATIAAAVLVYGMSTALPPKSADEITITILYDNTVCTPGTTAEWGFSCFIQCANDTVLYDAGTYGAILLGNSGALGVDLSNAKKMFLSHDHLDHSGGLNSALAKAPGVPVYVGAQFDPSVVQGIALGGGQPVSVTGPVEVSSGLYSTGELPSSIGAFEQSLVIDTDSGLVVVVGCSHPGIVEMLRGLKEGLGRNIFAVFGGFHLLNLTQSQVEAIIQEFRNLGVRKCGATHCTGEGPIQWISQAYGSDFLPMGVGRILRFSTSTVPVNGAVMWLSPAAIDFGEAEVSGPQDTVEVILENITPRPLIVSEISHTNVAYQLLDIPPLPATIHLGSPLVVRAVFHPDSSEVCPDTIRIVTDAIRNPVRRIPVLGEGFAIAPAARNSLYALGGQIDSGKVRIVDPATGATRLVGASGFAQIAGAKVRPSTGEIMALAPSGASTSLVRLSAAGNHFVTIKNWLSVGWKGMAFREDTLYITLSSKVYRWDMEALAGTLVKTFPSQYQFSGLAYRGGRDDFLACVGTAGAAAESLFRIDPATWTITPVGPLGMKPVVDILLDDAGNLFGVLTSGTNESVLLRIDPETGTATIVGAMGAAGIMALAGWGVVTSVGMTDGLSARYWLSQNFPNPFNPSTVIGYTVGGVRGQGLGVSTVRVVVYDVLGREVAVLINERKAPGKYAVTFDASGLASGVYLYRLTAGQYVETRKMVLMK